MNWTRAELKTRAKAVLKKHYLKLFIVSLILMIASGGAGISHNSRSSFNRSISIPIHSNKRDYNNEKRYLKNNSIHDITDIRMYLEKELNNHDIPKMQFHGIRNIAKYAGGFIVGTIIALIICAVILIIAFIIKIFVLFPLEVGGRKVFVNCTDNENVPDLNLIKAPFTGGSYPNMVKTGFLMTFKIMLGLLMFIVPGIKRKYEYFFVPYILAENPGIDSNRALEISKQMTQGHKFNIFKLQFSFIGWYLLGSMLAGIGRILVFPYQHATNAQLYKTLKDEAVRNGLASLTEFGGGAVDLRDYEQFGE